MEIQPHILEIIINHNEEIAGRSLMQLSDVGEFLAKCQKEGHGKEGKNRKKQVPDEKGSKGK